MIHELKTDADVFDAVALGKKTFEIRRNDRDFRAGDTLLLRKTQHTGAEMREGKPLVYSGKSIRCRVTYLLNGPIYGLERDWCIMSITRGLVLRENSVKRTTE